MEHQSAVEALSALAHESRLAVFRLLIPVGPDGLAAGVIGKRLGIPANALSFHLTRLRYAGLVTVRRNGQRMIYAASIRQQFSVRNAIKLCIPSYAAA